MVDRKLLDILVCPRTGAALEPLDEQRREQLNQSITAGRLKHSDGSPVENPIEDGLLTVDGYTVYRVDDGIPVMLPERGIVCEQKTRS